MCLLGSIINKKHKGLYFTAVTVSDIKYLLLVEPILIKYFGKIYKKSEVFDFTSFTDYYTKEMGTGLVKQFIVFEKIRSLNKLPDCKIKTNNIEETFSIKKELILKQ